MRTQFLSVTFLQLVRVPVPADGGARAPRRHALGSLRHVPPRPGVVRPAVAVGVGRVRAQGQPAGSALLQRVPAVLRACAQVNPGNDQIRAHGSTETVLTLKRSCS